MLDTLTLLSVLVIDQVIKITVKTTMYVGQHIDVTPWCQICFTENKGMAFGFSFSCTRDPPGGSGYQPAALREDTTPPLLPLHRNYDRISSVRQLFLVQSAPFRPEFFRFFANAPYFSSTTVTPASPSPYRPSRKPFTFRCPFK